MSRAMSDILTAIADFLKSPGGKGIAAGLGAVGLGSFLYQKLRVPGKLEINCRHGGQLVAEVLKQHGVQFVYTLVGGHISPILSACKASGIRVIDVRHEATAAFAADATARLTGIPGVAIVTAGPGLTNTITAVKNAQMAESPLVVIAGAAATVLKGRGALQDIDQLSLMKPLCKWVSTVERVKDIVPVLKQAFYKAQSGVPGPVFVELPIDTLYPVLEVMANMNFLKRERARNITPDMLPNLVIPEEAKTLDRESYVRGKAPDAPVFLKPTKKLPWVQHVFLTHALRKLFVNAFECHDFSPLPVSTPSPSARDIRRTAKLLLRAERPVIVVGSQAMTFRADPQKGDPATQAQEAMARLAEAVKALGCPVFLSGMARGLLGNDSSLHIRQNRGYALRQADVVILAGVTPDFRLDYGRGLPRKGKVISVNLSQETATKNSILFWNPAIVSTAHPALFLVELARKASDLSGPCPADAYSSWMAELQHKQQARDERNLQMAQLPAYGREQLAKQQLVNPLALCQRLEQILGPKAILIGDGGDFVATASYMLRPRGPLKWLDPGAFGTLGVGGGFALAAKLVHPDHDVWLIWGDGSAGYSIAEYDTFKRHGVAINALVGNDACWTQIEREQVLILDDDVACPLLYTPYSGVAERYGGRGFDVESPGEGITQVLQQAQDESRKGTATLVNALIGKTAFREGSLSVQLRQH